MKKIFFLVLIHSTLTSAQDHSKFFVGTSSSMDFDISNYTGDFSGSRLTGFSHSQGINAGWRLADFFQLEVGMSYNNLRFTQTKTVQILLGGGPNYVPAAKEWKTYDYKSKNQYHFLEVPLNLTFLPFAKKGSNFNISVGFTSAYLLSRKQSTVNQNNNGNTSVSFPDSDSKFNSFFNSRIGYFWELKDNLRLALFAEYNLQLNRLQLSTYSPYRTHSLSSVFEIAYRW